jgi:hypothetical protein
LHFTPALGVYSGVRYLIVACVACGNNHVAPPDARADAHSSADATHDARIDAPPDAPPPPRICGDGTRDQGEVCFAPLAPIDVGVAVRSARLVDVDRDGNLDLVYLTPAGIEIRHGNGLGAFGTAIAGPATSARYLEPGDFDADGHVDIVTAGANDMAVWRNDGATFAAYASTQIARPATGLATGDFDGYPGDDLVIADFQVAEYWRVAGANDLRVQSFISAQNTQHVTAGMLDDDTYADVILAGETAAQPRFGGNGGFSDSTPFFDQYYAHESAPTGVAIGDVDGDGHGDAIVATDVIAVYKHDATAHFAAFDPGCAPSAIAAVQLDTLAGVEIAIACDHRIRVASGNAIVRELDVGAAISDVSAGGDVNGDGIADPVLTLPTAVVVLVSAPP